MTNAFRSAMAAARSAVRAAAGVAAVYYRGDNYFDVTVVPATTSVEVSDANGMTISSAAHDFIIEAAELIEHGDFVEPAAGDQIRITAADGLTRLYEVSDLGSERCYRQSGTDSTTLRLHTRLIDTE